MNYFTREARLCALVFSSPIKEIKLWGFQKHLKIKFTSIYVHTFKTKRKCEMWAISNFTDAEKKGQQFFAMKSEELHNNFSFIELDNRWKHKKFWYCIQFKSYQMFLNIHLLESKLYSKIKHICVRSYLICMLCIICFNSIVIFDFKIKSLMYAQWNWSLIFCSCRFAFKLLH